MKIKIEDAGIGSYVYTFVLGLLCGAMLVASIALSEYQRVKSQFSKRLVEISKCPESVFQESTISYPDGGIYRCGAVREIPVNQKELDKWYREEAKRLFKSVPAPK